MAQLLATYGEALLRTHRALLRDLQALQAEVRGGEDLSTWLDRTRGHLAAHFRFEEENGYLASVLQRAPHLERAVQHLGVEHGELLRSLDALRVEGRSAGCACPAALRTKVEEWVRRVRKHERSENVLVQDAFNVDLTAED